jgi:cell division protein FtsB
MSKDLAGFDAKMVDLQQQVAMAYASEIGRLRTENAALRKTIAEFPSTVTDLQDRVTLLEGLLMERTRSP